MNKTIAYYHLPGLFEFYDLYSIFLELFQTNREYFYDWCEIGSIYGAPSDALWGGGRTGYGNMDPAAVVDLLGKYHISGRLTFSNSLLRKEHLKDVRCNQLCELFRPKAQNVLPDFDPNASSNIRQDAKPEAMPNGIILHSDLLLDYLKETYPEYYFVSSTTKVLTGFEDFLQEVKREDFKYVVPDFRLNKDFEHLKKLTEEQKNKVEFLCNECCYIGCNDRKSCYENVSRKNLGEICPEHICKAPEGKEGYVFSKAMKNPAFIGIQDIQNVYLPMGFTNFKIEGRGLGSAIILEFLLYYMTKPEYQLQVREAIYLDSMLDLF